MSFTALLSWQLWLGPLSVPVRRALPLHPSLQPPACIPLPPPPQQRQFSQVCFRSPLLLPARFSTQGPVPPGQGSQVPSGTLWLYSCISGLSILLQPPWLSFSLQQAKPFPNCIDCYTTVCPFFYPPTANLLLSSLQMLSPLPLLSMDFLRAALLKPRNTLGPCFPFYCLLQFAFLEPSQKSLMYIVCVIMIIPPNTSQGRLFTLLQMVSSTSKTMFAA